MVNYEQEKQNLEVAAKHLDKLKVKYEFVDLETAEGDKFPAIISTYDYKKMTFDLHIVNNDDWLCVKCLILDTSELDPELACAVYRVAMELNFELPETTFSANDGFLFIEADMKVGINFEDFKQEWDSLNEGLDQVVEDLGSKKVQLGIVSDELEEPKEKPAKKKAAKKKSAKKKKGKKK